MTNKKSTSTRRSVLKGSLTLGATTAVPSSIYADQVFAQKSMYDGSIVNASATDPVPSPYISRGVRTLNIKDLGAAGDNVRDDTQEFLDLVAFARAENSLVYFPAGKYRITEGAPVGAAVSVIGESRGNTILYPDFATPQWLFDFNSSPDYRPIRSFSVSGTAKFSFNEKFLRNSVGYKSRFDDLAYSNVGAGIELAKGFTSFFSNLRGLYVTNPIKVATANGVSVRDVYFQRYQGNGIDLSTPLSAQINNVIFEYGSATGGGAGGNAIILRASQNVKISGVYTEGGSAKDLYLAFKNQRPCVNTTIENLWSNTGGTTLIYAASYNGLSVKDVVMQTPAAPYLIDLTDKKFSRGLIDVGRVVQVDQNANGYLGDVRGAGQTLIPIASDNRLILLHEPASKVGDTTPGDVNDLSNIANHTASDANGYRPWLNIPPKASVASMPGGLTATSTSSVGVFGGESSGIYLNAREFGTCKLKLVANVSNSAAMSGLVVNMRLTNETTGERTYSGVTSVPSAPDETTKSIWVNVAPGRNKITMACTKEQRGKGTNTVAGIDFEIE